MVAEVTKVRSEVILRHRSVNWVCGPAGLRMKFVDFGFVHEKNIAKLLESAEVEILVCWFEMDV